MLARTGLNTARTAFNRKAMQQRRWTQVDTRGGKPKLLFRFGLKDVPVELYPLAFCVGVAGLGGVAALGRQMANGTLRLKRDGRADPH
ncbi:hypothetical protein A1Q2_04677 [Trichosporon asahii var. asahii CBS 8904]|uniref:Uncharacterized protein n=2 Tax=Trichosporon asahii var. asahii TaxID=189963 RepID=K1VAD0_TRIAC|nr:hypothetical protein A1Q1_00480 [Trichosporon asahii var. asahii CBS 2479]EJT50253.1 hypothetical protein A1Q1_00480 [Trichosporon asahii var. asahii CBS 2479]EKD00990.1 hypothetical protein A1Q2_04677 [Trichosporon asahii var. asahii CBS 8904]